MGRALRPHSTHLTSLHAHQGGHFFLRLSFSVGETLDTLLPSCIGESHVPHRCAVLFFKSWTPLLSWLSLWTASFRPHFFTCRLLSFDLGRRLDQTLHRGCDA